MVSLLSRMKSFATAALLHCQYTFSALDLALALTLALTLTPTLNLTLKLTLPLIPTLVGCPHRRLLRPSLGPRRQAACFGGRRQDRQAVG